MKIFFKYLFVIFVSTFIGITGVFADTTIDTADWINVTGIKFSQTGLFYTGNPTYNNDWLLNNYYVYSGTYVNNGADWNYVEFSYFEHSGGTFNPCNSTSKFTANFSLLFTAPYLVDQVTQVKWGNDNCAMTSRNNQTGVIELACGASPSTGQQTDVFVYYSDSIFQQNQGYIYISRDIDISCGLNTDAIINNDNANTQNIINNQNQNTQDIINNQNQNTQDMIDSQKVCTINDIDKNDIIQSGKFLGTGGAVYDGSGVGITDYINIESLESITVNSKYNNQYVASCFYTSNKSLISCIASSNMTVNSNLTVPSNAYYFRASIYSPSNEPTFTIKQCKNGNQALDDSINDLDGSLNDDDTTGAASGASEFFSSFDTETFGLTSIITAPLNLIRSVLSSTCTELQLPLPYLSNKYLTLPCMSTIYGEFFGSFFTIYQTITYGIIAYWVCVRIFNQVKDFKNPEHDEIEVMDL